MLCFLNYCFCSFFVPRPLRKPEGGGVKLLDINEQPIGNAAQRKRKRQQELEEEKKAKEEQQKQQKMQQASAANAGKKIKNKSSQLSSCSEPFFCLAVTWQRPF